MTAEESTAAAASSNHQVEEEGNININSAEDEKNGNDVVYLQAKCSLLQNQLSFLRSQQKQKKEQRKKEKGEIVSTFKSMKDYIDHLEQENKQFKALLVTPSDASSEEEVVTILRQRLLTLQRENQRLKQDALQSQTKCQSLQAQCTRLEDEVSKGKAAEAQLRDQVEKYEQVVDRVPMRPAAAAGLQKHTSMSVMADAASFDGSRTNTLDNESLYGGAGPNDLKDDDMFGKVVDHTPITPSRHHRSNSSSSMNNNPRTKSSSSGVSFSVQGEDDTVFGVTDRAELASIQDLDEEDDETDDDDDEANGGEEWAGSVAADNISLRLDIIDEKKNLVDHVPAIPKKPKSRTRKYGASSVVVVPDVSVASGSRMDDNTVGDDDNLFGKMVDQTPDLTMPYSLKKTGSSVSFRDHLEDDTVLGVTEKLEIESVARQDDDVSSHGGVTVDDDETATRDGISIAGVSQVSVKMNVAEEKNLVDHVPRRRGNRQTRDASVIAIADNYSTASPMEDIETTDGGGGEGGVNGGQAKNAFGPIVDHTPNLSIPMSAKSAATSVVTQNSFFTDLNDDYDRDGVSLGPASTLGDPDWDRDSHSLKGVVPVTKHLVDHVPKRKRTPSDLSVRVFMDKNDDMSQVDTIAEDEEMEFGPIVDQTPFSATKSTVSSRSTSGGAASVAGSTMAVGGGDMGTQDYIDEMDTVQDTFMDTGTIASIPEEEDSAGEDNVVDHVPSLRKTRSIPIDASVRVLVDVNETMSQVDTIAEDGILDFGPIVDHTPQMGDAVTPSGGARSVAASTAAVGDDNRTEGDLESTALHTTVTTDITLTMAEGERFIPLAGEEKHVVDHVPSEENRPSVGGSIRVVLDHAETLSQVDTVAEEERVAFGPIVDHTPAFNSSRARSVGASMLSVGSNDDSTSIQDNTTVGFGMGASVGAGDDIGTLDDNSAPAYTPAANEDKKLVDHVPQSSFPKSGDVSVMVQADPLDAVFEVDDETGNGNVRTDRYGPIVDQTPLMRPSASPSVATSMLTTTSDNAVDVRSVDGTWLSGSTERGDTAGEVSLTNSRDVDQAPSAESAKDSTSGKVKVETVTSYDSDDLTDDAYVRVSKEIPTKEKESEEDGRQSIASDEDGGFDLKEMHSYAEELAAKASESKDNPFDLYGGANFGSK